MTISQKLLHFSLTLFHNTFHFVTTIPSHALFSPKKCLFSHELKRFNIFNFPYITGAKEEGRGRGELENYDFFCLNSFTVNRTVVVKFPIILYSSSFYYLVYF